MAHRLVRRESIAGRVFEQFGNEVDGVWRGAGAEDFGERVRFDLREFVLHVLHAWDTNKEEGERGMSDVQFILEGEES
jgi:hypothetical protein